MNDLLDDVNSLGAGRDIFFRATTDDADEDETGVEPDPALDYDCPTCGACEGMHCAEEGNRNGYMIGVEYAICAPHPARVALV